MLKKTVLVHALALAFGGAALTMGVVQPAMAQSNASGTVSGRVEGATGASLLLTNTETGQRRTGTVDAAGRFQVTALPPGHYKVDLVQNGKVLRTNEVDVLLGQGVDASFLNVQSVQVTGRRSRIDVTTAVNGAVFTAKELEKLPVQPNLNAIVLLAPNTTKGDSAFGNTASFGGSGASENAFYLNGFPITNPLSQLGSMELPFGAIQQANVLTGGFGAEFGRSIGGVMSITSKSGTNNWEAGAMYALEPDNMRSKQKNVYYPNTGANPDTDGTLHYRRDNRSLTSHQYGGYVGGPIIKDKLFMFVSADQTTADTSYIGASTATPVANINESGFNHNRTWENRWLGKIDWNITDEHRLEFTSAGDDYRTRYERYGYTLNPNMSAGAAQASLAGINNNQLYSSAIGRNLGPTDPAYPGTPGAKLNMVRYTGNLTDDLTLTAVFGRMKSDRGTTYEQGGANSAGATLPPTVSFPATYNTGMWPAINKSLYRNYNVFSGYRMEPGSDDVKAGRIDLEYKIGKHTLRAGIDQSKLESTGAGQIISGGSTWSYRFAGSSNGSFDPTRAYSLSYSRKAVVGSYGASGADGYIARQTIFNSITDASSKQNAQYIEDRYQATKDLLVTFGLRNDGYSNSNGDGQKFIDMSHQIAPRLSASWDVNGDASLKVFGSAGRYYLQLPTQVAARAASRSTYTAQDFVYTGVDPKTGVPTGLTPINTPLSADGEYGQLKDPRAVVVKDLKPNYQDEITLGFEKAWSPNLNFGGKVTYRRLGAGIDDSCDTRPIYDYALKNGIDIQNPAAINCFIYNPGRDVTVWVDGNDAAGNPVVTSKGQYAHFTAAQIGEPKAKRNYAALDVFLEHPMRNGWFGRVNYTLSRSSGNMEGQTRSDTGQTDVGTSAAWDFPEFAPGSNGLLPNDRKHALKAFGYYQITPEWTVGANALLQSGRPRLCLGTNDAADSGTDPAFPQGAEYWSPGYGPEYYWCGGKPAPRGSQGRLPWEKRVDLNLVYAPALVKGLAFKVDVFNVFNSQTAVSEDSTYDVGADGVVSPTYRESLWSDRQAPRYVRFQVEYNHKF
ncbi:MAG: TonB-dependent receptor [Telluria sp.]